LARDGVGDPTSIRDKVFQLFISGFYKVELGLKPTNKFYKVELDLKPTS